MGLTLQRDTALDRCAELGRRSIISFFDHKQQCVNRSLDLRSVQLKALLTR